VIIVKVLLYINFQSFIIHGLQNVTKLYMVVTTVKCFNFGISKCGVSFKVSLTVLPLAPNLPHSDIELSVGNYVNFALGFIAGYGFSSLSICLFLAFPKCYPAVCFNAIHPL